MLSPKTLKDIINYSEENYVKNYGELVKVLFLNNKKRWLRIVLSDEDSEIFALYFYYKDTPDDLRDVFMSAPTR